MNSDPSERPIFIVRFDFTIAHTSAGVSEGWADGWAMEVKAVDTGSPRHVWMSRLGYVWGGADGALIGLHGGKCRQLEPCRGLSNPAGRIHVDCGLKERGVNVYSW